MQMEWNGQALQWYGLSDGDGGHLHKVLQFQWYRIRIFGMEYKYVAPHYTLVLAQWLGTVYGIINHSLQSQWNVH